MGPLNKPLFLFLAAKEFFEKGTLAASNDFKKVDNKPPSFDSSVHARLCMPVVNIIFGLELSLKGLLKYAGKEFKASHNLKYLFNLLDIQTKEEIIFHYQSHDHYKNYLSIRLIAGDGSEHGRAAFISALPKNADGIQHLLDSHKEFFISFRYLFELDSSKEVIIHFRELCNLSFSTLFILGARLNHQVVIKTKEAFTGS